MREIRPSGSEGGARSYPSFLPLSFLESVPEVPAKLKEPETKERKIEEVVKSVEQVAMLVLVY